MGKGHVSVGEKDGVLEVVGPKDGLAVFPLLASFRRPVVEEADSAPMGLALALMDSSLVIIMPSMMRPWLPSMRKSEAIRKNLR